MDFELSEEQQAFADSVARFAREKLAAGALRRAHSHEWDYEAGQLIAEQGLLGIAFAQADGGQGGTLMHAVLAIEQVALACPRSADIVQVGNFGPIAPSSSMRRPSRRRVSCQACCPARS
ncbi:butyryl-CoA dehydrogenase [Alicycliphilus sp. B1]|nr:butyryl-CoA dehydrogenase [Alicycliphilus sp. B1]